MFSRATASAAPVASGNVPLLVEPANTLSHLVVAGTGLYDTKGVAWSVVTEIRRRPRNQSPIAPGRQGMGVFTSNTRPTFGSGNEIFDVSNFWAVFAFVPVSTGTQWLFGNGSAGVSGYHIGIAAGGACTLSSAATTVTTANAVRLGALNVLVAGRSAAGTSGSIMLNGGATVTGAVTNSVDTTRIANLGTGNAAASPFAGSIYEFMFVSAAYDDAQARAVVSRFFSRRVT